MLWRKTTWAMPDPVAAQKFSMLLLNATYIPQVHPGGNGSCAKINWVAFPGTAAAWNPDIDYQWHFVERWRVPPKNGLTNITNHGRDVERLRNFSSGILDAWALNHVGMWYV